jgi:hypothetical protein
MRDGSSPMDGSRPRTSTSPAINTFNTVHLEHDTYEACRYDIAFA